MEKESKNQKASTRAKSKYNAKNYDQVHFWAKKGDRAKIDAIAAKSGKSRAAFILEAIEEKIERERLEINNNINEKELSE